MTTLVGIVARKGKPGVVLASDVIGTSEDWDVQGDVKVRRQEQGVFEKIYLGKEEKLAIAMAGTYDREFREFLYNLRNGELDFNEAVKNGCFNEFRTLNLKRAEGRILRQTNSLLVANRSEGQDPMLYSCWPLGRVDNVPEFTSLGSGSEHAIHYLQSAIGTSVPREVSIPDAITHAHRAILSAGRDIYTKGFDFAVISNQGIKQYGSEVGKHMDKAMDRIMGKIKKENE